MPGDKNSVRAKLPLSKSHAAFARAQQLIPGGVNSPARAFGAVGGEPLFIARGEGAYLFDIDGNRLIDFIGSWGPMILGHAHPRVTQALVETAQRGTSYGAPTEAESHPAELIIAAGPSVGVTALCNIDSTKVHLGWAAEKYAAAKTYVDWRKTLDDAKEFDAVLVSTPDHMHAPIGLAAIFWARGAP